METQDDREQAVFHRHPVHLLTAPQYSGVILHKVHKHGTHAAQTSYLFSVNDPHHQIHNGAQFPHLFLFPFPPTIYYQQM